MPKEATKNMTFEQAIAELEKIVEKMENGGMSLDESVRAYTRGNALAKLCREKLEAAEASIRVLEKDGTFSQITADGDPAPVQPQAPEPDSEDIPF